MAMCVGNAVMLALVPFKALAETCVADNNAMPNMPILLGVALIGATVGGCDKKPE